jgi:hypothetical protein
MKAARAPLTLAFLVAWAGPALACCAKGRDDSKTVARSTRVFPGAYLAPSETDGTTAAVERPPLSAGMGHPDPSEALDYDGAPLSYTVVETRDAPAIRADPDETVVESARKAAGECFSGLAEGPDVRSAHLQLTVVPSGRVSRTEVAGPSEPGVVDCLRRTGNGLRFRVTEDEALAQRSTTEPGNPGGNNSTGETIRSFSIDVTVTRAH